MNLKTIFLTVATIVTFSFSVNAQETKAFKASAPETKQKTHEQKVEEYHQEKLSKQINVEKTSAATGAGGVSATGLGSLSAPAIGIGAVVVASAVYLISEDSDSSGTTSTTTSTSN